MKHYINMASANTRVEKNKKWGMKQVKMGGRVGKQCEGSYSAENRGALVGGSLCTVMALRIIVHCEYLFIVLTVVSHAILVTSEHDKKHAKHDEEEYQGHEEVP
jgi:hypothetical protein